MDETTLHANNQTNRPMALVTGASSGMGLKYSEQLAAKGYDLLMVSNQEEELQTAATQVASRFGIRTIPHYQDLAQPTASQQLLDFCEQEHLEIEVLINNAGMFFFKELQADDLGRVNTMMSLHMDTVTQMSILFGSLMKQHGHGYILIMSSMAAKLPTPGITIYSATKAYLKSFGKSLSFEMRPYGVGVTTVCPAAIATPLYRLKENLMNFGVRIGVIKTPDWLVRKALKGMFRKKPTVRPGFMNIYLPILIALLPRCLEDKIWKKFKQ